MGISFKIAYFGLNKALWVFYLTIIKIYAMLMSRLADMVLAKK